MSKYPFMHVDASTGSATDGMAAYLWYYGVIDEPTSTTEQGYWLQRPGQAALEIVSPRDDIQAVKLGGQAVTVLCGELNT